MSSGRWELRTTTLDLPLRERFTIARESWDSAESVLAILTYDGVTGVGEAQPAARWGEDMRSVLAQLDSIDPGAFGDPFDLDVPASLLPAGSARCALDIALHDVAGQVAGLSIQRLLGAGSRTLPPTSITVPINSIDDMVARARELADYPILKVKVGFDDDVEAVRALREVYTGVVRIDANEGWTVEQAVERLAALADLGIELCEQPIAAGELEGLAEITRASAIPVYADEDACTSEDVARLRDSVDGVNLKLRKAGGIRETVKAISVARAHGMGVMLGCNLESGIATSAAAHVAGLVDRVDLDGPLLLAQDPFPGVSYELAELTLPDGPGLGLETRPS